MTGDLDPVPVRVLTEKVVRSIGAFVRALNNVYPFPPQILDRFLEVHHFQGDMAHGIRDGFSVDHKVELASGSNLVPVARKIERWPGNGLQP